MDNPPDFIHFFWPSILTDLKDGLSVSSVNSTVLVRQQGVQYYQEFLRFEGWPDPCDPWLLVTRSKSLIVHDEDGDDDRSIRS